MSGSLDRHLGEQIDGRFRRMEMEGFKITKLR